MRRRDARELAAFAAVALALAGCGEDPQIEEGPAPFKGTDTSGLRPLRDEMTRNMQGRSAAKSGGPGPVGSKDPAGAKPGPGPSPGPATKGG